MNQTIEQLWQELKSSGLGSCQKRVDPTHPHDLYADFEHPDRLGLIAVCSTRPATIRPLRAIEVEHGARADGRWSLRIALQNPALLPVFTALCQDIIAFTRKSVAGAQLASATLDRIARWRSLLEKDAAGLGEQTLRGLIGELLVLEHYVLSTFSQSEAIASWTGPRGGPQDFLLPSGSRIEVKAIGPNSDSVQINGLAQLDAGSDPLLLLVVRLQLTGSGAANAVTAPGLIAYLRDKLSSEPETLTDFDSALACLGWHEHSLHEEYVVRPLSLEEWIVGPTFPRLVRSSVPRGVSEAEYQIILPPGGKVVWRGYT